MRIGLVAMSGIRACDEELLELGLTLPGFVERSKVIASLPSLGLLTLAGMTPAKHSVEYIEVPDIKELTDVPDQFDLIAISTYSAQIFEAYELAERYREKNIPTVIGGPHVTAVPEEAAKYCDAVVIGEGELYWYTVLEDAENKCLKKYYGKMEDEFDLNNAPMPAFELLDISKYNRITVQTSRGCPHHCEFCASSLLLTKKYKQKPLEKVIAEIEKIRSVWKNPFIEFADDNSIINRAYWKELLLYLKDKHIRWFTETDISVAQDEELLTLMREAGCAQVLIGLESPSETSLEGLEMKNNWKHKRVSQYKEAIRIIQSHGITVNGCFIFGLDGQTVDIFDQVFDFVKETELYEVQITLLTPFPGTPLYERLHKENRLLEPLNWKKCTLFDLNFEPANMTGKQLRDNFMSLGAKIYSDEFTNWRHGSFKKSLRTNRKTRS
jgi:radical SAM superfamily enzyme YgiQ (UPF0313 family)